MLEPAREYAVEPYYGEIGGSTPDVKPATERKHTIVQSLWTRPLENNKARLRSTLCLAALSLAYAHRSGYKVHMHTDSKGMELLKGFGYERLVPTLDNIPASVPTELFAAGKFFAMRAEGNVGFVHTDLDVFLKKQGVLDAFYEDTSIDGICQQEEDYGLLCHFDKKIKAMRAMGCPAATNPEWRGSMNTGIVGFYNPALAAEYINNYFAALALYTKGKFDWYRNVDPDADLLFDFILEQVNLSYMSRGYKMHVLVPTHNPSDFANEIGYQHLQGGNKWDTERQAKLRRLLAQTDRKLYEEFMNTLRKSL